MRRTLSAAVLLRVLLAAGALLAGLDLHALEARGPLGAYEAAEGQPQLHCGGCTEHEHLPAAHDTHGCTACKTGATRAAGLLPDAAVRQASAGVLILVSAGAQGVPATSSRGTLGARGPPGTNG